MSTEEEREAELRIAWLSAELNRHLRLYHQEDAPEISDAEYDELFRELSALQAAYPALVRPDSPPSASARRPLRASPSSSTACRCSRSTTR